MSSSSVRLEWFDIREMFVSTDEPVNLAKVFFLVASCDHPDARWITEVVAGREVKDARAAFLSIGEQDARALCFAWLCSDQEGDLEMLGRSAKLGYAFAQALMSRRSFVHEEKFYFARLAAAQGDRDGFLRLGYLYRDGRGCEKDLEKAKANFFAASELGHPWAMVHLGYLLQSAQRWALWGRAALLGDSWHFLDSFADQIQFFNSGLGSAGVVFAIGKALHGHVNEEAGTIFEDEGKFESLIGPAKQAIAFYQSQIKACRKAVDNWTLVGICFGVVKDVRKLIAKLIWDAREEALYKLN
jgi:hypothetical protein